RQAQKNPECPVRKRRHSNRYPIGPGRQRELAAPPFRAGGRNGSRRGRPSGGSPSVTGDEGFRRESYEQERKIRRPQKIIGVARKRRLEARGNPQLPDFDFRAEIREPFAFAETRSFFNVFSRSRTVALIGCNRTLFSCTRRLQVLPDLIWAIIASKSLFAAFARAWAM